MAASLSNVDGKLMISYLTGNGIITSDNGQLVESTGITEEQLSDTVQTKLNSIDSVNSAITTAQSNISTLQSNMSTAQSNISTLQSNMSAAQSNISTLQTNISTAQTNIASIEDTLSNLSGGGSNGITLDQVIPTITTTTSSAINNFAKQWYTATNSGTPNIIDIACSGDGKYIFVCPWSIGSAQFSNDYGTTWSTPSNVSANIWSCAMNLNGQYIILADNNNYKISTDFGATFTVPSARPSSLQRADISGTGKYIACACSNYQGLQVSSDYGASWTKRETSVWTWNSVTIALDGSIIYGCSDNGLIKKSTDYGNTWTTVYTDSTSRNIKTLCCSSDGKYVMATLYNITSQILLSSNYGVTFQSVGDSANYYTTAMSKNGMYMIGAVNGSSLKYSTNYGSTWSTISNNLFTAVAMSYNGEYMFNVSPYNKVIISKNENSVLGSIVPAIPTTGSNYFSTNKLYVYNGTAWVSVTLA